ncbi:unnamed protein product, partial [marine sediment metagenome]
PILDAHNEYGSTLTASRNFTNEGFTKLDYHTTHW